MQCYFGEVNQKIECQYQAHFSECKRYTPIDEPQSADFIRKQNRIKKAINDA